MTTAPATIHSPIGASSLPPEGSASSRKSARPAVTTNAATTSRRVIRCAESQAPRGSAKTIVVARIGCTTTSRPSPSAAACIPKAIPYAAIPPSQTGCWISRKRIPALASFASGASITTRCWSTVPSAKAAAEPKARITAMCRDYEGGRAAPSGSNCSITRPPRPRVKKLNDQRISTSRRFWKPIRYQRWTTSQVTQAGKPLSRAA